MKLMKLKELEGKAFRVISAAPWEILLEEEVGITPGAAKFLIRAELSSGNINGATLEVLALREELLK